MTYPVEWQQVCDSFFVHLSHPSRVSIKASAPAKVILFGEHAVVYGEMAIAATLDLRMNLEATPSDRYTVDGYAMNPRNHTYIQAAVDRLWDGDPLAFRTRSLIPSAMGLGSSSALTVASVGMLLSMKGQADPRSIALESFRVESGVQEGASPLDTSACTHGYGIRVLPQPEHDLLWDVSSGEKNWSIHHQDIPDIPLVIGTTRQKGKTEHQVEKVRNFHSKSGFARDIISEIGEVAALGARALADNDVKAMGELMDRNQRLLAILGVNTPELQRLIEVARKHSYGAKITGAGGGGSMIALTDDPESVVEAIKKEGGRPTVARFSTEGVQVNGSI